MSSIARWTWSSAEGGLTVLDALSVMCIALVQVMNPVYSGKTVGLVREGGAVVPVVRVQFATLDSDRLAAGGHGSRYSRTFQILRLTLVSRFA